MLFYRSVICYIKIKIGSCIMETSAAIIHLTGKSSERVLNGLLISQVSNAPFFSAMCNRKGQVVSTCFIQPIDGGYQIAVDQSLVDQVIDHLNHYSKFDRVKCQKISMYSQMIAPLTFEATDQISDQNDWLDYQLETGRCLIKKDQSEKFTPLMLALDQLGSIDMEKGCYLGQEIVVRIIHRGVNKRFLRRWSGNVNLSQVAGSHILFAPGLGGLSVMDDRDTQANEQNPDVELSKSWMGDVGE